MQATYECLRAWSEPSDGDGPLNTEGGGEGSGKRLFAFFNSGEESGASQPHRHLQFLPVEAMRAESKGWDPLIDLVSTFDSHSHPQDSASTTSFQYIPNLPFKHFALPLPRTPTPETLHKIYLSLYNAAVSSTKSQDTVHAQQEMATSGPAGISYNLAMTLSTMMICPRKSETATVPVDLGKFGDIADPGVVSVNGTILAGTLMVKSEGEWDALREEPELLGKVLGNVGFN